jgi:hypothetical protein
MAAKGMLVGLAAVLMLGTFVSAQERKSYAELNAPFIMEAFEKTKLPTVTKNVWDSKKNAMIADIPENKGLYLFYYATKEGEGKNKKDKIFPIYIGTSGGTFRRTLRDHYEKEGGVIRTILEGKFPANKRETFPIDKLKVKMVDLPKETEAKMFERAMLETFYFALNDQETRSTRYELDNRSEMVKPLESKTIFDIQLRNIMTDLQGFYDTIETN